MAERVVIVGGGVAGALAAASALKRGASVVLIARGFGETALTQGTIDYFPQRLFSHFEEKQPFSNVLALYLEEIQDTHSTHPYLFLCKEISKEKRLEHLQELIFQSLSLLNELLEGEIYGKGDRPFTLLDDLGFCRRTYFTFEFHVPALERFEGKIWCVGLEGYPTFNPHWMLRVAETQPFPIASEKWVGEILPFKEAEFSKTLWPTALGEPIQLARKFEQEESLESFIRTLKESPHGGDAKVLMMPAILGFRNKKRVREKIKEALRCEVVELICRAHSLSGLRLQEKLHEALEKRGAILIKGRVGRTKIEGKKVLEVGVLTEQGIRFIGLDRLILATGSFTGGGLLASRFERRGSCARVQEPVLNLPVQYPQRVWFEEEGNLAQPLFKSGVRANADLQPLDDEGKTIFSNVQICGALLGGFDASYEHYGLGTAALTGYVAGR